MIRHTFIQAAAAVILFVGLSAPAWSANSVTTTIWDHPNDSYGSNSLYETTKMDVTWDTDDNVTVDVYTAFAGKTNQHYYSGHKIQYGDLFIGPSAGNWDYAFHIHGRNTNPTNGEGWLIDTDNGFYDVDDYHTTSAGRRNEIISARHTSSELTSANQGSWSVGADTISFSFNLGSLGLTDPTQLAFRWAMSCANDIVSGVAHKPDGSTSVPEPTIITLMLAGIAGFGAIRRRRPSRLAA